MVKVLIVEDNDHLNKAYKLILEKSGHEISVAFNGEEGLVKASEDEPAVILLDILMPKMDGIAFMKAYDAPNKHKNVKVVILTNLGEEKQVQEAMALGAHRYILKAHASPQQLATIVSHVVKKEFEPPEEE